VLPLQVHYHENQTHFCTEIRLETEAQDNSKMTYWTAQSKQWGRQAGAYAAGGISRASALCCGATKEFSAAE